MIRGGWVRPVTTPASTAALKMESASAIPVTRAAVVRVSAPDMENASITNATAARSQEMLTWGNTVSCPDVQDSAQALITASVTWRLRNVSVLKDGLETIVVHLTAQENQSVLDMEAAAIPTQEGTMQQTADGSQLYVLLEPIVLRYIVVKTE